MGEKLFFVSRQQRFSAFHSLQSNPVHQHAFTITITFYGCRSSFDNQFQGCMLINYFDIDKIWKERIIVNLVDDRNYTKLTNSSCETIAEWLFDKISAEFRTISNASLKRVVVDDGDVSISCESI